MLIPLGLTDEFSNFRFNSAKRTASFVLFCLLSIQHHKKQLQAVLTNYNLKNRIITKIIEVDFVYIMY